MCPNFRLVESIRIHTEESGLLLLVWQKKILHTGPSRLALNSTDNNSCECFTDNQEVCLEPCE